MALFPCSVDGARYRGPQQSMYPALVAGSVSDRSRLRLCPPHFQKLNEECRQHLEEVVYDEPDNRQEQPTVCAFCGSEPDGSLVMFVTVYGLHQPEAQFFGRVCHRCEPRVRSQFLIH